MPASAQRQFLVKIQPVPGTAGPTIVGYWARATGGETSATLTKVYDGGSEEPEVLAGVRVTGDLTLSRPYDPARDQPVVKQLRPLTGRFDAIVTVQPTDADLVALGDAESYTGKLARVTPPTVDAASSDASMFELMFTVASVA